MAPRGAVFVLPTVTAGQQGPVASWLSAAGWADAARRVLGASWLWTPSGLVDADEARSRGSSPELSSPPAAHWRRRLPRPLKHAWKDSREWRRARAFRIDPAGPWRGHDLAFVWQRHELFHRAGLDLARTLGVPAVLFVPATLVWQSREWDAPRLAPGLLERLGETPALRRADLVAAGSDLVAEQALRLGASPDRLIVTPTGVDVASFAPPDDPAALRRRLDLDGRFVVGWTGSFRRFHGLDLALDATEGLDGVSLLLVGDGPERDRIARAARERGIHAVLPGTVPHHGLPEYLATMDVALVLGRPREGFHYSPLKLAEYLAAGRAVVAPRVGQLAERLRDDVDAVLVEPGDAAALRAALVALRDDPSRRERLGQTARRVAEKRWSWDHQVRRVLEALGERPPARSGR